jgi:hypothetical protein
VFFAGENFLLTDYIEKSVEGHIDVLLLYKKFLNRDREMLKVSRWPILLRIITL